MYRIINNICPDYLKNYVSYTSDISCRHTRSTNCNQLYTPKPNCELFPQVLHVLWRCHLEFSPLSCLKLPLTLLNMYIENGNALTAIELLVLLLPIWFCISYWFNQWYYILYWSNQCHTTCLFYNLYDLVLMSL